MFKKILLFSTFLFTFTVFAQVNLLETTTQARQRHSAENYQHYKKHGTPLGGYPESLGNPAPSGTEYPGYRSSYKSYNPYSSSDSYLSDDYSDF